MIEYDLKDFFYDKEFRVLDAQASYLGWQVQNRPIYAFVIRSEKTGRSVTFYMTGVDNDAGSEYCWHYMPSAVNDPDLEGLRVVVFNQ